MQKKTTKKHKDKNQVILSQCVGKITAYLRVGKTPDAKIWAKKLVEHLTKMGLLT